MTSSTKDPASGKTTPAETASYLAIPADRRALAIAHAAMLSQTAGRVALELPLSADVDDFRRVLAAGAGK